MKGRKLAASLLLLPFFLSACAGTAGIKTSSLLSDNSDAVSESSIYHQEYSMYYSLGIFKGLELYCWNIEGDWFGGLMSGTNVIKGANQVEELQDIACPISILRDILWTYPENTRINEVFVCVVSVPPLQEELDHSGENTLRNAEGILYLCDYFGIDPPGRLSSE